MPEKYTGRKMKCYFCGGEMKKGKTTYTINKKMEPCSLCGGEMEKKVVEVIKKAGERKWE